MRQDLYNIEPLFVADLLAVSCERKRLLLDHMQRLGFADGTGHGADALRLAAVQG